MGDVVKAPREYLREPYSRVLTPDEETGTYTAEIREFPGCVAQGDSPEEAYRNLEATAESWIEIALDLGQEIPKPSATSSHSGKIVLRLPKSLHRRAAEMAEHEGTSLNQFLVAAVAERLGTDKLYVQMARDLQERAQAARRLEERAKQVAAMHARAGMLGGVYGSRDPAAMFGSPVLTPEPYSGFARQIVPSQELHFGVIEVQKQDPVQKVYAP